MLALEEPGFAVGLLQKSARAPTTKIMPECLMVDVVIPAVVLTVLGTLVLYLIFRFAVDAAPTTYMLALGVYANFQDTTRAVDDNLLFTLVLVKSYSLAAQFQAGGRLLLVLRNLALASLEVGTAELFQKKYYFPPVAVGLFCALIVFTALPVQLLYERLQGHISLHAMLWASFAAGCFLMFESFSALFTASMLFFPMMALSSGIVMAHRRKMQEYVMPDGSLLDRNTTTLLGLVMADFLGRGLGPISARYGIYLGGQRGFALTQVTYAALSLVLFVLSETASKKARKDTSESSPQSQSEESSSSKGD
ncbi:unnamed protein product [Symbiodinium sp. CCMP2592]|nr:unnamed protein product [Symbiodinium sp. CCMP2592]